MVTNMLNDYHHKHYDYKELEHLFHNKSAYVMSSPGMSVSGITLDVHAVGSSLSRCDVKLLGAVYEVNNAE